MSPIAGAGSPRYSIFVLSVWEERGGRAGEVTTWRFSLEGSQITGRKGFGSLAELTAYLNEWTRSLHPVDPADSGPTIHSSEEEPES